MPLIGLWRIRPEPAPPWRMAADRISFEMMASGARKDLAYSPRLDHNTWGDFGQAGAP